MFRTQKEPAETRPEDLNTEKLWRRILMVNGEEDLNQWKIKVTHDDTCWNTCLLDIANTAHVLVWIQVVILKKKQIIPFVLYYR